MRMSGFALWPIADERIAGFSEADSDAGDDVDEVLDLLGNWGLTSLKTGGKSGNSAHHLNKCM